MKNLIRGFNVRQMLPHRFCLVRYQEHSVVPVRSRRPLSLNLMEAVPVVVAIGTVVVRIVQQLGATTRSQVDRAPATCKYMRTQSTGDCPSGMSCGP
jgi:hypothetical protein